MTNILLVYYSAYGHIYTMAKSITKELDQDENVNVRLVKVPEFEVARKYMSGQEAYVKSQKDQDDVPEADLDDLKWADGILWGIPTRFGNMPAQVKQFLDTAGGLWQNGDLEGKPTAIFTSTNTFHGGQETTIISSLIPLLHFGMIFVGLPYNQNPELMAEDVQGGSPYGASTVAGADGSRTPDDKELTMAKRLGKRLVRVASSLKSE